jgi:CelD/BcsL family acetyltransferase involved in cellulose biosynthesis
VTVHGDEDAILGALPALVRLHAARAKLPGRRCHPDQLAAARRRAFLADALTAMARRGGAQILTLDAAGGTIAAQLVLLAPTATYLGFSGIDPDWWHVSGVTLLQLYAAEGAVERGHRVLNLSVGPSVYKLRWSEQVVQHPEFIVCGPGSSVRLAYTAFRMAAAASAVHRESARHQRSGKRKETARAYCPAD